MNKTYSNLSLSFTEKTSVSGYHFCVTTGCAQGITAFKTAAGLKDYLKRTGLKLEFIRAGECEKNGKYIDYRMIGKYQTKGFHNIEEIPAGFTTYFDVVNGSYVPCYYGEIDGVKTIFNPNPNSENCYKSCKLPLEAHRAFSKTR